MTRLKALRLLCGHRQLDVSIGTGIPLYKIAAAERGRMEILSGAEKALLSDFFTAWLKSTSSGNVREELATLLPGGAANAVSV